MKGNFYKAKRRPDDMKKGLECFQQAIARDPNYALAYVGIANSYNLFASYATIPMREGLPRSRAAAEKALEIPLWLMPMRRSRKLPEFMTGIG